jgi:fructose-1,6-bisphosphatase/inositol monophosphatase family enzyme
LFCREAGKLIVSAINKEKKIQTKTSSTDLVTETDKACEELIVTKIKDLYPDHEFIYKSFNFVVL